VREPLQKAARAADEAVSLLLQAMEACHDPLGILLLSQLAKDAGASRDAIKKAARMSD
jgi:hypothetical protein